MISASGNGGATNFSTALTEKSTAIFQPISYYLLLYNPGGGLRVVNAFGVNLKFRIDRGIFAR
jgi:hypothetical protein